MRLIPSLLMAAMALPGVALANAKVGAAAPDFTLTAADGSTVQLSALKGKTVVLEWTNHECPFVKKHYESNNMQQLQASATSNDVVWLTINSGAPGKQGHVDAAGAMKVKEQHKHNSTAYLLDADGVVGRLYGAKTTPHMYVIDTAGTLQYAGAIDSVPSADKGDIPNSRNYVSNALAALAEGKTPDPASTQPYGCSVKY